MSRRARFCLVAISGFVFVQAAASLLLRSGFALTAASDLIQSALLLAGTLPLSYERASHARTHPVVLAANVSRPSVLVRIPNATVDLL